MKIFILDDYKVNSYKLPQKVEDSYLINYHSDDEEKSISVQSVNGIWNIQSNDSITIVDNGKTVDSCQLTNYKIVKLFFTDTDQNVVLVSVPSSVNLKKDYLLTNINELKIGSLSTNNIVFPILDEEHVIITKENGMWKLLVKSSNIPIYVNKRKIVSCNLTFGDEIFILGLKIIWLNNSVRINTIKDLITINGLAETDLPKEDNSMYTKITAKEKKSSLYKENEYFFHTPNLKPVIEKVVIEIENPPLKERDMQLPLFLSIGASAVFSISSLATCIFSYVSIVQGKSTWNDEAMNFVIGFSLLIGSLLFPILTHYYEKSMNKKREAKRQKKYSQYLQEKKDLIDTTINHQKNILKELYLNASECQRLFETKNASLWSREISDKDFLTIRLGIGRRKADIVIDAPKKQFSIDDDNLKDKAGELMDSDLSMTDVPITVSLIDYPIFPIILNTTKKKSYIESILLQLMTYYSSIDLKLVFLVSEKNNDIWNQFKFLAHSLDDQGKIRMFAYTDEEAKTVSYHLESKYQERFNFVKDTPSNSEIDKIENKKDLYQMFSSYYLIITDNIIKYRNLEIIEKLFKSNSNYGFSILIFENAIRNLPSKCNYFSNISDTEAGLFSKDVSSNSLSVFSPEFFLGNSLLPYINAVSNIPIDLSDGTSNLPQTLEFLEMYKVGKIEQLNITTKWQENDPTISLIAPVGVHPNGNLFELNLHEKEHGPHGLIAGSTGSGKSEFIITYILSMCINYSPLEVQFVLIDYKGGGLAGAFENREKKSRVPHIIGTITNLDTSEMNRTLVSIRSELKRRQRVFNEARDMLGESTIDIYKYQKYYREGQVKEPIAHLFIVSDEFAELKSQQPDFMDELVSTARIGRSLGVHLILATQKPSGVVDDQIWSNARFKVCLKVQSEADSQEMLRRPEAATLKEIGRFYLQVGYDEIFEIGQSAWSGAKYIPSDIVEKKIDDSINFISNNGTIIKSVNNTVKKDEQKDYGEQLTNIVKYLINIAQKENIQTNQLWLPSIPNEIYLGNIVNKYNFKPSSYNYQAVIGEYDDPENQLQGILTLDVADSGNILIYGTTGSGKENQLSTILYSLCIYHSPEEINIYIMDFGAEVLKVFSRMPQVGDYASSYDNEKIENLLQMLERELNKRRSILSNYGGSFTTYNSRNANKLPLIFVILNGYESFFESFNNLEDGFNRLFREGSKYGIIFAVTASATNALATRVSQNFMTIYALRFNDDFEFRYVLNAPLNLVPKKVFGRGLTNFREKVVEYQTAYINLFDMINDTVKETAAKLASYYTIKAKQIPTIPSKVNAETMAKYIDNLTNLPIGVNFDDASISTFNFKENKITPIIGNDLLINTGFLTELYKELVSLPKTIVLMLDLLYTVSVPSEITSTTDATEFVTTIKQILNKEEQPEEDRVIIIAGISKLFNDSNINDSIKKDLSDILNNVDKFTTTSFIIIEEYQKYRNLMVEDWYQNRVSLSKGIWIGEGFENQIAFQVDSISNVNIQEYSTDAGYIVSNGKFEIIKTIEGDE
mgnify:FL=1